MRLTILLLLISFQLSSQTRTNEPLPIFSKKPIAVLKSGVRGWSLSKDGQWMSSKKTIPMNLNSLDKKGFWERGNKIGLDNFKEWRIYPVVSGHDTLVLLTKLFEDGYYKYKKSKRGWTKVQKCHFYLFNKNELKKLDALQDSIVQNVHLSLMDDGVVSYEYNHQILTRIKEQVVLKEKYGYDLIVSIQPITVTNTLRFQFYAMHKEYREVKGVLKDLKVNGETIYGTDNLFDNLYYETDIDKFSRFFTMPESFKFKL